MPIKHAFVSAKSDGADNTVVQPSDWNADHVGDGTDGVQYVVDSGGSDSFDGLTWGTAKATIQAAVDALPTTPSGADGGVVLLSQGIHTPAAPVVIAKAGVYVVGAAGNRASRISVGAGVGTGRAALEWKGNFGSGGAKNLKLISTSTSTHHMGILVEQCEALTFDDVWFQSFGNGLSPATNANMVTGPCAMQIRGISSTNSDWHQMFGMHMFNCYRGLVLPGGGTNSKWIGGVCRDVLREGFYARKQTATAGGWTGSGTINSARSWVTDVYFKASFAQNANYLIRMEVDASASSPRIGCRFTDCETEIVNSGGAQWGHHIYCDAESVDFKGHDFTGGQADGVPNAPHAIFFGPQGSNNSVGPYTVSAQGGGTPYMARNTAATGLSIWQPSDYTGTTTVV